MRDDEGRLWWRVGALPAAHRVTDLAASWPALPELLMTYCGRRIHDQAICPPGDQQHRCGGCATTDDEARGYTPYQLPDQLGAKPVDLDEVVTGHG